MADNSLREFNFELILAIGGILALVGLFLPWASGGGVSLSGFHKTVGSLAFVGGWIMIVGAMIGYDLFQSRKLDEMKPYSNGGVGIIGALIAILGLISFNISVTAYSFWAAGSIVVIIGALAGLFSSFMMVWQESTTEKRTRTKSESGGL